MLLSRRDFLAGSAAVSATAIARAKEPARFFTVQQRGGRWLLVDPEGKPFFSLGLNHIDSSPLRQSETIHIWREKYGNSVERWLKEAVAPDLREWGFNSVGWTQEVVIRGDSIHRHSPPFTFEEYQWLGLPYCHLLPFAEIHQWENETRHPDFFSRDFEEWCDYVARSHCARLAEDSKLLGYFYTDCPTWVHTRPGNAWKGPLFPPDKLQTPAGRGELTKLATRYYQVTHDAIRRYDRQHLIFGDRYEAKAPLPTELLLAAKPYVDVLSFQHFGTPRNVQADLKRFHEQTGMPVLYADGCVVESLADGSKRHSPVGYAELLEALRSVPACVGLHLCGAYLKNRARRRGLRNEDESPDVGAIAGIRAANESATQWITRLQ